MGVIGWIGKKLAFLDYQQQHFNADFRFSLVRLRQKKQSKHDNYHGLFHRIFTNFIHITSVETRLTIFNKGYSFLSYSIGLVISMPFYLAKTFYAGCYNH